MHINEHDDTHASLIQEHMTGWSPWRGSHGEWPVHVLALTNKQCGGLQ